jgi:tRNA pseudouridine38-40 synthase
MRDGLNAALPRDIACLLAQPAHPDFHAIRSATGKLYRYVIRLGEVPSALGRDRAWQLRYALDLRAMAAALEHVVGTHDFTSFRAAGCAAKSPIRHLDVARIQAREEEIWIEFYGAGFLRHMVRNLVGSLMEVGRHKREPTWFAELLEARNRQLAGPTAPALGLHLVRVDYPADLLTTD